MASDEKEIDKNCQLNLDLNVQSEACQTTAQALGKTPTKNNQHSMAFPHTRGLKAERETEGCCFASVHTSCAIETGQRT